MNMGQTFCSTIIPTIGRASLERAVLSVLNQDFPKDEYEIIVVNDSGNPLPENDWQRSGLVRIVETQRHERSVARNTGAAIARGQYLHFLDDDDWLLPGALKCFKESALQNKDAAWLYGGTQLVDREGNPLIELYHGLNGNCFVQTMAGEWIPLQASIIKAETFFSVGGFNPLLSGPEDIDLCRRISLTSDLHDTTKVVASIGMGSEGSTTDQDRSRDMSRWAREKILDLPCVFSRMWRSADSSQWMGRISRIYLTSLIWNLQHQRLFTAASRATYGLASIILAGRRLFSRKYWKSFANKYESDTFRRGILAQTWLQRIPEEIAAIDGR